jgi:hypothetical protein
MRRDESSGGSIDFLPFSIAGDDMPATFNPQAGLIMAA